MRTEAGFQTVLEHIRGYSDDTFLAASTRCCPIDGSSVRYVAIDSGTARCIRSPCAVVGISATISPVGSLMVMT